MPEQGNARNSEPTRVVVVGGGAAGVITATHLLRVADGRRPVQVTVVEPAAELGRGLAYRADHPRHTLNNFAGRLSAVDGDPRHLLEWCAERRILAGPTSFLLRSTYGEYLADVLDGTPVPRGSRLIRRRAVVVDVETDAAGSIVTLDDGDALSADAVVLALGNPPPRRREDLEVLGDRYVADPWTADLTDRVRSAKEVLLLGTGLTMVDVLAQLHDASPETRFTAVSRTGLMPAAHKPGTRRLHDVFDPGAASLDQVVARVRARVAELEDIGGDWRDVVDSVRVCANDLWRGFSPDEQDRFVAELSRTWETARHRMSPVMDAHVAALIQGGVLRVTHVAEVDLHGFDAVVNCTGPAPLPTPGWNPLVDVLLRRGTLHPHRLGLGLDLTEDGQVRDRQGDPVAGVYAVGAARRGVEWEVAAVPDLRVQAAALAPRLLDLGHRAAARQAGLPA